MGKRLLIILLLLAPYLVEAQEKPHTPTAGMAFGLLAHSYGFGFDVRFILPRPKTDLFVSLSLTSFKNAKELKIESAYKDQGGKNYVFDKLNYCYAIAPNFGFTRRLISRDLFNRVGVSASVSGGPVLALLKPYYVEVAVPFNGNQAVVEVHRYDPAQHNFSNIYGVADYFLGMNELTVMPGMRAKVGTLVDFAASSDYIRAVELSLFGDFYAKKLPIFGSNPNKQFFVGGSIEIMVGNTW